MKLRFNRLSSGQREFILWIIGIIVFIQLTGFCAGIENANSGYSRDSKDCSQYPKNRISYFMVGYGVGCWMGKPLEKDKK